MRICHLIAFLVCLHLGAAVPTPQTDSSSKKPDYRRFGSRTSRTLGDSTGGVTSKRSTAFGGNLSGGFLGDSPSIITVSPFAGLGFGATPLGGGLPLSGNAGFLVPARGADGGNLLAGVPHVARADVSPGLLGTTGGASVGFGGASADVSSSFGGASVGVSGTSAISGGAGTASGAGGTGVQGGITTAFPTVTQRVTSDLPTRFGPLENDLNLPGSIGSIGSPDDQYDPDDSNCICPETSGWTSEQLSEHQKKMNISGGPFDCFCVGPKGFVLVQQRFGKKDADNKPTMNCFCPKPPGWSPEQFTLLTKQKNFSGGSNDCFCSHPSDIPEKLGDQLASSRLLPPEDEEDGEQSHLSVVSLDGLLREVRLGPLLVTLH